jgi:hypothetical protein
LLDVEVNLAVVCLVRDESVELVGGLVVEEDVVGEGENASSEREEREGKGDDGGEVRVPNSGLREDQESDASWTKG